MHIAIVDYGMGNLRSVSQALQHVAADCKISIANDPNKFCAPIELYCQGREQCLIA